MRAKRRSGPSWSIRRRARWWPKRYNAADPRCSDPTGHAEMLRHARGRGEAGQLPANGPDALRDAGALRDVRRSDQPCADRARWSTGAADEKGGAVANGPRFFEQPTCHSRPDGRERA